MSGAEGPAGTGQHDAADRVVLRQIVEVSAQVDEHRGRQRIQLVGTVERKCGDRINVGAQNEIVAPLPKASRSDEDGWLTLDLPCPLVALPRGFTP